jgi:hypothetical protein
MSKNYEHIFVVDRAKWKNSHTFNDRNPCLLNPANNSMCCLGFVCHQLGVKKSDLKHISVPQSLGANWDIPYLLNKKGFDSKLTREAVEINDNPTISPKEKEKELKKLFKKHNLGIKFIGKAPV